MKKAFRQMTRMCDEAWYIFIGTLKLSCAMLLCAFLLLLYPQGGYEQTMLAAALSEAPEGLLLLSIILAALIDERHG